MVSAADSLSMESESSSEASAGLVVSGRALLMMGDAFRGPFPKWWFFWGGFLGAELVFHSLILLLFFFPGWLCLTPSQTPTLSRTSLCLSLSFSSHSFLSCSPARPSADLHFSQALWHLLQSTLFPPSLLLLYILPPAPLCIQINYLCTRIRLDYLYICISFRSTCSI